jgi:sigma-E factor negative regulatory protein RseC
MIEEEGLVVGVAGEVAEVETRRGSSCGGCAADGACSTSLLDRLLGRRPVRLHAINRAGAAVGDQVVVGVDERALMGAAIAAYLVPILALLAGALLGRLLGGDAEAPSLLGASVGLLLAFVWLRRYSARLGGNPAGRPVVLRRKGGAVTIAVGVPERPSRV